MAKLCGTRRSILFSCHLSSEMPSAKIYLDNTHWDTASGKLNDALPGLCELLCEMLDVVDRTVKRSARPRLSKCAAALTNTNTCFTFASSRISAALVRIVPDRFTHKTPQPTALPAISRTALAPSTRSSSGNDTPFFAAVNSAQAAATLAAS